MKVFQLSSLGIGLEEQDAGEQEEGEAENKRDGAPAVEGAICVEDSILGFDQSGFAAISKRSVELLIGRTVKVDGFDHLLHEPVVPPDAGLGAEE